MIQPSGISVSFGDGTALRTFGNIAVHIGVFHRVHFGVTVRARRRYRQRQNGHDHHDRQDQTQDFTEFFQSVISFHGIANRKRLK